MIYNASNIGRLISVQSPAIINTINQKCHTVIGLNTLWYGIINFDEETLDLFILIIIYITEYTVN